MKSMNNSSKQASKKGLNILKKNGLNILKSNKVRKQESK